ncbi:uncharacterized protein LOC122374120 [Amphibalanus amphitrite]|uniref:uncharacterized protein LOC122374120 n=1 Tax=Amphibalanus amphitrite TaxID=1232801 RepID=UPI001C8FCB50|nr:uncharacterized protein LOC122374120 [Amphibalanus amphitrite]
MACGGAGTLLNFYGSNTGSNTRMHCSTSKPRSGFVQSPPLAAGPRRWPSVRQPVGGRGRLSPSLIRSPTPANSGRRLRLDIAATWATARCRTGVSRHGLSRSPTGLSGSDCALPVQFRTGLSRARPTELRDGPSGRVAGALGTRPAAARPVRTRGESAPSAGRYIPPSVPGGRCQERRRVVTCKGCQVRLERLDLLI